MWRTFGGSDTTESANNDLVDRLGRAAFALRTGVPF